jgi:threonine dehydrogenase-like Zn-dependent dehydrogenase
MRAITVLPGTANSGRLDEVPEPDKADGALLVRALALGICGTDREILAAAYGTAPPGSARLILGHESLGVIEDAPSAGSGFARGEHVVGIVRRPDPVPCACCAVGEWDMCRNGRYTERGIKERHGFGSERFRLEPDFAIKVDPTLGIAAVLMEPTTIVAKGWDQADTIAQRARTVTPRRVLVTGAGPVGLLAALLGKQRMLDVHVLDRAETGPKADLTRALGGTYHHGAVADVLKALQPDVVMECTAAPAVIRDVLGHVSPNGVVCLLGVSSPHAVSFDIGAFNHTMVLENQVVFGSVNANRSHYEAAARALAAADRSWLERLISRRVPLPRWQEALENRPDDIKVVIDFAGSGA